MEQHLESFLGVRFLASDSGLSGFGGTKFGFSPAIGIRFGCRMNPHPLEPDRTPAEERR